MPFILASGAEAFSEIGSEKATGTKIISLSGSVERAGVVEVPMGTTLRTIISEVGGGPPDGRRLSAVAVGGPSSGVFPVSMLGTPIRPGLLHDSGVMLGAGGVIPPHESFMPGVREICSKHGILLIADEVITAFGRTGDWSGSRHWGVQPDMMCTAKAITNGYFPFGAVMISDAVAEVFEGDTTGKAAIGSGYTYSGHPVGAAAAIACLKETERLQVKDNAAARGAQLWEGLKALKEKHTLVGDVRGGHGLMCAVELVSDRATKAPIDKKTIGAVHRVAYENGAMLRVSGPNIILSPPLVLTEAHVDTILTAMDAGLTAQG